MCSLLITDVSGRNVHYSAELLVEVGDRNGKFLPYSVPRSHKHNLIYTAIIASMLRKGGRPFAVEFPDELPGVASTVGPLLGAISGQGLRSFQPVCAVALGFDGKDERLPSGKRSIYNLLSKLIQKLRAWSAQLSDVTKIKSNPCPSVGASTQCATVPCATNLWNDAFDG